MSNAEIRGLFVWHELMTTDPQSAAAFYAGLFRWQAHPSSVPDYTLWMSGGTGVGGLMAQPEEARLNYTPPTWLVYLGTADVDATVHAAQRLGGRVLKDAADIPSIGRFAVLADPQGAAFAVFTPAMPAPEGAAASRVISQFSWHELATSDPQGALDFYSSLFGWDRGAAHDMGAGNLYQLIERESAMIGGLYRLQDPSKPPYWLAYVKVDDLDGTVAAARAAGGQIVQEPQEVPGGDRVARILDPQGGVIALHELRKATGSPGEPPPPETAREPARRPSAHKTSRPPASKRPATRLKAKTKAKAEAPSKTKLKPKVEAAPKAKTKAKSKRKAKAKAKATTRKATAKRSSAKARKSARRSAPVQRSARKSPKTRKPAKRASSPGKTSRKPKVAKRAKRKASRRRR